jgi:hypothetical protein
MPPPGAAKEKNFSATPADISDLPAAGAGCNVRSKDPKLEISGEVSLHTIASSLRTALDVVSGVSQADLGPGTGGNWSRLLSAKR